MQPVQHLTLEMPLYVWALVGVLALAWIYVLLPEKLKGTQSKPTPLPYLQLEHDFNRPPPVAAAPKALPSAGKWTPDLLRSLDTDQLTELVRSFWQVRACQVEVAGRDLLIYRPSTARLLAVAHCAPSSASQKAGVDQVQALLDLVLEGSAPLGLYYGLSGFSPEALALAKDKPLKLLTGGDFLAEIGHLRLELQQALLERITAPELAAAA